jgi:hypothetical protein
MVTAKREVYEKNLGLWDSIIADIDSYVYDTSHFSTEDANFFNNSRELFKTRLKETHS